MGSARPQLLLVYDGSTIADRALDVAIERARSSDASIMLLAVVPPRLWRARRGQFQIPPEKHDEEFARAQLARARERCHAAGIHTDERIRSGPPAHVIAEEAAAGFVAIVMGERRSLTGAPSLARVVAVPDGTDFVVVA